MLRGEIVNTIDGKKQARVILGFGQAASKNPYARLVIVVGPYLPPKESTEKNIPFFGYDAGVNSIVQVGLAQSRTYEEVFRKPLGECDRRIREAIENLGKEGISVVLTEVGINQETGMMTKEDVLKEIYGPYLNEFRDQIRIVYET